MRAWLMNISLVDGWFPATLFSVTAVLAAILLGTAIWETVAGSRDGGKRTFAVVVCPVVIAIIAGIAGLVIAWLLSDVFVVFGVELGRMWSHGPVAVARSLDSRFAMRCSIGECCVPSPLY